METIKAINTSEVAAPFRSDLANLRRRMLGLSQAELAVASGISQPVLSKIEDGLKSPSESQQAALASALRCPVGFFFQKEREYGAPISAHPMFRKRAAVGVKVLNRFIAELNVRIAHLRAFVNAVDIAPELPMPQYDVDDFAGGAEEVAANVRRAWYMPLGPVKSLMDYVERSGCIVVHLDMAEAQIDGVSYRIPGLPPIIFLNSRAPADRQRFSLAHELGHLVMHAIPHPEMEEQANQFASALLMPKADVLPYLRDISLERAAQLKKVWRVSMGALIVRAKTTGAIDHYQSDYLWRQMSALGYRTQEPPELAFEPEVPTVFPALVRHFTEELEYDAVDLERVLALHFEEVASMYGLKSQTGLRLVR
ncbi:MAG: ImmA/IrrE family metallo-endopeptidase [Burkholderiales bacterium]|nr:ImmA/IrrE family metallo-endopeptidase [Burkholderiales bacterium]